MSREMILVNLQRCTGCWSCAIGCKMVNELADDDFRISVETIGNGKGTDRPAGVWPQLSMDWRPVWSRQCTDCAEGNSEHGRFCVYTCPSRALKCGAEAEAELARMKGQGWDAFELQDAENVRPNVWYMQPGSPLPAPGKWERYKIIEEEFVADDGAFAPSLGGTIISELAEHPETKALLDEHLSWLDLDSEEGKMSAGMTLAALAPFLQGLLDDETLALLGIKLGKIAAKTFDVDATLISEIAENPYGMQVLQERMGWLDLDSEEGKMSAGMTLAALAPFSQGLLDDETLEAIRQDFKNPPDTGADDAVGENAADGSGRSFSVKSKIGDIASDSAAWNILAKYMPGFEIGSKEFNQAKGMSVKMMAKFAKDMLPPDKLEALDAELLSLGGGTANESDASPRRRKGFFARIFHKD